MAKRFMFLSVLAAALVFTMVTPAFAQSGLEGRITETIGDLVRIVNILILGFVAWAGFLIAKGDGSGLTRLIYGIVGLIVVNASNLIINYFS
jgi:hypothetical protein